MLALLKYFSAWTPVLSLAHLPRAYADRLFEHQRIQLRRNVPWVADSGRIARFCQERRSKYLTGFRREVAAQAPHKEPRLGLGRIRGESPGLREKRRAREEEIFLKLFVTCVVK
jgi:hypothetical protein